MRPVIKMNTLFVVYARNAATVDGTDVQRVCAAIGKYFKFPMDVAVKTLSEARTEIASNKSVQSRENSFLHIETRAPQNSQQ